MQDFFHQQYHQFMCFRKVASDPKFNLASQSPNITALLTQSLFSLEAIHKCLNPSIQAFASLRCHQHVLVTNKVLPSDFTQGFRCRKIVLRVQKLLSSLLLFVIKGPKMETDGFIWIVFIQNLFPNSTESPWIPYKSVQLEPWLLQA